MLTGNKGEWAEIYVHLKLLADGKLYAADEHREKMQDFYFPIIKIIRNEIKGKEYHYYTGKTIKIFVNEKEIAAIPAQQFEDESLFLFEKIKNSSSTFSVPQTETFMNKVYMTKIKAPSRDKTDIQMQINDVQTGIVMMAGFSIKTDFSSKPTLLNPSGATNFVYKISNFDDNKMAQANDIDTAHKLIDRMNYVKSNSNDIVYYDLQSDIAKNNFIMIDSKLPEILAYSLLYFYTEKMNTCTEIASALEKRNPLNYPAPNLYSYKIKKLLSASALGMLPHTRWNGLDDANGGYIVVQKNGEVLAYHIYNRNSFEEYLFQNTKFDKPSTSRYKFCEVYKEDNEYFIKLNLQIRFIPIN